MRYHFIPFELISPGTARQTAKESPMKVDKGWLQRAEVVMGIVVVIVIVVGWLVSKLGA
jgi:hypothetical protein